MPAQRQSKPRTVGSASFDPDDFFSKWGKDPSASIPQSDDQFRSSIVAVFNLKPSDDYVYNATASVTLSQVQQAINHGSAGGLKAWYLYDDGLQVSAEERGRISSTASRGEQSALTFTATVEGPAIPSRHQGLH